MSWIDRIQTDFTITTGDGAIYTPNMLNASKNVEYNVSRFEFIDTPGTLVVRGTPRGTQYGIEIIFQGENHLDTSADFEASAADPKPWTISHPFYGSLLVQPVGLVFDNAMLNMTRITGGVVETIDTFPDRAVVSPAERILADKETTDAGLAAAYVNAVPEPSAKDLRGMLEAAAGAYNAALASIHNPANVQDFVNAFNEANALLTSATSDTLKTFQQLQAFYSLPMTFTDTVLTRIDMLTNMLAFVNSQIRDDMSRSARFIYQATAGTIISAIVGTLAIGTVNAFTTRRQALNVLGSLLQSYNQYFANLDRLQSPYGGLPFSFIPSWLPLQGLAGLVGFAADTLLSIADTSRQERSVILADDTNVILLTSQLVGLKADDSTIDELIAINSFGFNDLLGLRKGRQVTYYL